MDIERKVRVIVEYVQSLADFQLLQQRDGQYDYMGATITDAMLQARVKYETVVNRA